MAKTSIEELPTPESIAKYVKANAPRARKAQQMHHGESVVTRETDYKGHHIVVRTKYEVEVDGRPLMGHMGVNDAGSVHYHPVPNLNFASALDMVKKIIDVFPDDFEPGNAAHQMRGMDHGSHEMSGMVMKAKPVARKASGTAKKRKK
jgi:hypothetical protein